VIRVKTNKNIIFFFSILAKLNPQEKYHTLGETLLKNLEYGQMEGFREFKKVYEKNRYIPIHPYQFSVLSMNTKNDLSPKSINPECGFGEKTLTNYKEKFEPLVKEIYKKSNFEEIYKTQIVKKYEELNQQIQKSFNGRVEDSIKKIWDIDNNYECFLIPNFLEIGHSFGIFRNNKLYSITSPIMKDGEISFRSQFVISNSIHEFSHSVFQKFLIENDLYQKHKALTKNIKIPKELINIHSNSAIYMEETLIKLMTLLIQQELYKEFVSKEDQKFKAKRKLDQLEKKGYKKAGELYSILQNSDDKKERYLDYLSKNI
jgi:hypothetical protein